MGSHLSTPNTTKQSEDGTSILGHAFGVSTMQGWRRSQEDAHLVADVAGVAHTAIFGVFDGHGGREVSNFTTSRFAKVLQGVPAFSGSLPRALAPAFHRIDELLNDKANLEELKALKAKPAVGGGAGTRSRESGGEIEGSGGSTGDSDVGGDGGAGAGAGSGQVRVEDAVDMLQKMMLFKRMKQQQQLMAQHGAGEAPAASGGASVSLAAPPTPQSGPRICTLPPSHVEAGCTAVVACVRGDQLVVANAGDSRAVLCRSGIAVPLSEDHKPALPSESARIEAAGGWVTPQGRINGNLNLSRALGDLKYKQDKQAPPSAQIITAEPDVRVHTLTADDEFLVLACDGVWDIMSNQQAVDFVRDRIDSVSLSAIAEQMFDHCISDDPKATQGGCSPSYQPLVSATRRLRRVPVLLPTRPAFPSPGLGGDNMTALIVKFRKP